MCKITQIPFLFTECHHLSVVAAFEPCTDTHVPDRPALFCGPAEWAFTIVAEMESHPSRCKNCRSRPTEATPEKVGCYTPRQRQQSHDLISFSDPSGQQEQRQQSQPSKQKFQQAKSTSAGAKKTQAKPAKPVKGEPEEDNLKSLMNVTSEEENDEELEEKAAKYGMSLKEYKEILLEQKGVSETRQSKRESIWREQSVSPDKDDDEEKAPNPEEGDSKE